VLDLPLVNSTRWKGANSIVVDILARKSARWDKLSNRTGKPPGEACGC